MVRVANIPTQIRSCLWLQRMPVQYICDKLSRNAYHSFYLFLENNGLKSWLHAKLPCCIICTYLYLLYFLSTNWSLHALLYSTIVLVFITEITISSNLISSFNTLNFSIIWQQNHLSVRECPITKWIGHLLSNIGINQSQPDFLAFWPISNKKIATMNLNCTDNYRWCR